MYKRHRLASPLLPRQEPTSWQPSTSYRLPPPFHPLAPFSSNTRYIVPPSLVVALFSSLRQLVTCVCTQGQKKSFAKIQMCESKINGREAKPRSPASSACKVLPSCRPCRIQAPLLLPAEAVAVPSCWRSLKHKTKQNNTEVSTPSWYLGECNAKDPKRWANQSKFVYFVKYFPGRVRILCQLPPTGFTRHQCAVRDLFVCVRIWICRSEHSRLGHSPRVVLVVVKRVYAFVALVPHVYPRRRVRVHPGIYRHQPATSIACSCRCTPGPSCDAPCRHERPVALDLAHARRNSRHACAAGSHIPHLEGAVVFPIRSPNLDKTAHGEESYDTEGNTDNDAHDGACARALLLRLHVGRVWRFRASCWRDGNGSNSSIRRHGLNCRRRGIALQSQVSHKVSTQEQVASHPPFPRNRTWVADREKIDSHTDVVEVLCPVELVGITGTVS